MQGRVTFLYGLTYMTDNGRLTWRPGTLVICHLAAAGLLGSWLWPVSRALWDALDRSVFYWLNGTLEMGAFWRNFWTVTNWRPFDLVSGGIIFIFAVYWIWSGGKKNAREHIAALCLFALLLLLTHIAFSIALKALEYRRSSPTRVLPDAIRLAELVKGRIKPKDASSTCFPGDHAFVLAATSVFLWGHRGWRAGLVSAIILGLFTIPRLVGGHWITDNLVGTGMMVLVAASWWFCTPLCCRLPRWIVRSANTALSRIGGGLGK